MGVAATIGATLLGGFITGRAQQQQYNAAAQQAEVNAQIADQNADKLQAQAEEQSKSNTINEENKRRRMNAMLSQQRANIGASGIAASGSAASALADSAYNMETELAIERYNSRQGVENIFQQSTDLVNQRDIYNQNARNYRKAGKRAFMNSMLMSGLSLAGNLYSPKSAGKQGAASYGKGSSGYGWGNSGNISSLGGYDSSKWKTVYGTSTGYKW
jgi:uncharacterized protein (DUF2147 family)|nr:MAG TPA: hypothetical protein [Caudoviricetes sp.]